jgi:hypothetical protein
MRSHLVEVVPGPRRAPAYYLYDRGGTRERIPAENVVAWHDYQPEESPIGASPLDAVQLQYETAYDLMRLFQKTVRAGGVTAGYFSVIQPTNGVPIALTEEQKNAIAKQLRRMRAQSDLPTILDQIKFEKMGLTPAELQTIENRALTDADICRVLGVPAWLIGIRESSGGTGDGSTTRGADEELRYWLNNKATLELRDAVMTERLVPMFGEKGVRFRTDLSGVAALNRPLLNNATNVTTLSGRPIATVNELRRPFGLPPIEDPEADELYIKPEPQPFGGGDGGLQGSNAPEKPAAKAKRLIDTPERAERWRGKDALMRKYEARFERAYVTMLRERKAEILRKLEAEGLRAKAAKRTIDLDALMSPDESDEAKIQRIYEQLIAERGAEAAREIALELEVNLQNREVQAFIESRKTVGLDGAIDTFLQELRLSIADGIGNGEGLSEIAGRIATKFEDYEQGRVLTIARTETVSAFNFASVEAWRQSGDVEQVEWLSARDSAVREAHADADGQVAGINAGFDVGGESLAFPGDPAGSPENVINCRCVALPVVNERARRRMWERYFPSKNGHANRLAGVIE